MKQACLFALMTALLVACAPVPPKTAASVADTDPLRRAIVDDVVDGLSEVYEPSDTILVPARTMSGALDTALLAALRAKGFTVANPGDAGDRFDNRVDLLEGNIYRVTATIDGTTMSRLWVLDGANAYPGGSWARRE